MFIDECFYDYRSFVYTVCSYLTIWLKPFLSIYLSTNYYWHLSIYHYLFICIYIPMYSLWLNNVESTGSQSIREVDHYWSCLVLKWETTWKHWEVKFNKKNHIFGTQEGGKNCGAICQRTVNVKQILSFKNEPLHTLIGAQATDYIKPLQMPQKIVDY